jgi:hypothetical protein
VFGDVGDPQVVRRAADKVAVDQVHSGGCVVFRPWPASVGQVLDSVAAHQESDRVVPDGDPASEGGFGVYPWGAVDLGRLEVDLADLIGEPGLADCSCGGSAVSPVVVAGGGHAEDAAGEWTDPPSEAITVIAS